MLIWWPPSYDTPDPHQPLQIAVVTLISIEDWNHFSANDSFPHEDVVWGVVYTIDPEFAVEVKAYLGAVLSHLWDPACIETTFISRLPREEWLYWDDRWRMEHSRRDRANSRESSHGMPKSFSCEKEYSLKQVRCMLGGRITQHLVRI